MATSTILSNPKVQIGAAIGSLSDLSDQVTAAVFTVVAEPLEDTAFGSTSRTYTSGLFSNSLTLTMYLSFAADETYAKLSPLVGTKCTVKVNPTSAVDGTTNPGFILTDCYLSELPVINASLGELQVVDIELQGGVYSADVTNP
jgi:hypothetical protein